jgi:hypothetical protein
VEELQTCENCGRKIGRLETPNVWREHVVCADCYAVLSKGGVVGRAAAPLPAKPKPVVVPRAAEVAPRPPIAPPTVARPAAPAEVSVESAAPRRPQVTFTKVARPSTAGGFNAGPLIVAAVCLAVVGGVVFLVMKLAKSGKSLPRRDVAVVEVEPRDPEDAIEAQLTRLAGEARAAEAGGSLEEAAIKYKTIAEFLRDEAADSRHQPLLKEAREKAAGLTQKLAKGGTATTEAAKTEAPKSEAVGPSTRRGGIFIPPVAQAMPDPAAEAEQAARVSAPAVEAKTEERVASSAVPAREPTETTSPGSPPPAAPSTAPAATKPAAVAGGTPAQEQIARGVSLLLAADYDSADSAFKQALALEPRNPRAFHGRGLVAYLKNKPGDAAGFMETALKNSPGAPSPRVLTYNLAVVHLKTNAMRGARLIKDYLAHPKVAPDEQMANALGTCLNLADDSARNHAFYNEARDFYMKYDQKLAAARGDGTARWGTRWISAAQAAAKWALYRQRAESLAETRTRVGRATLDKKKAYDNMRFMQRDMRLYSDAEKRAAREKYEAAAKNEIKLREQLQRAEAQMAATETPPLPTSLEPILDP